MAAGKAVATLFDEMQQDVRALPLKKAFQQLLQDGGQGGGHGQRDAQPHSAAGQEQENDTKERNGLPIAHVGDGNENRRQKITAIGINGGSQVGIYP